VTFTRESPLSRSAEMARRTLTPLTVQRAEESLRAAGQSLREQPIDPRGESFALFVPDGPPPAAGFGLLVFISPFDEPAEDPSWREPLDRRRMILVSAANSGNEKIVLDRRLPLALLAYENVRARFPLDPGRVYVGGFSGGSRVAEIVALAYPDVFRGALLHAGSEPIGGERGVHLPPADLFHQFQQSRLVYVTGEHDARNLHDDEISRDSMREWCVSSIETLVARGLGHEWLDLRWLDRALEALDRRPAVDAGALARCNARLDRELAAKLSEVESALARGDRQGARALLQAIDARYAGLAATEILRLWPLTQ
jgi:pimeloyl-ACP methyl ester carboxylesterase